MTSCEKHTEASRGKSLSPQPGNIILVGFMGTGKTTVGRLCADLLAWRFLDMDVIIETREKRTIGDIFKQDGEACFRNMERNLVRELAAQSGLVIATGGGVILDHDNVRDFQSTGLIFCLRATPVEILKRIEKETHRPLVERPDKFERICSILESRRALYDAMPFQVDTTGKTPQTIATEIVAVYRHASDENQ